MAVNLKPASADAVRAWAQEQGWTDEFGREPSDRGRLPTTLIADFDQAHKRNRVHYVPGFKDKDTNAAADNGRNAAPASNSRGSNAASRQSGSRSTEVATRPTRNTAPARQTKPQEKAQAAPARQESPEPVRVEAQRVSTELAEQMPSAVQSINIEDAIALLQSAATAARENGEAPKGLFAYYVLA